MNLQPVTITGRHVRLEPLGLQHAEQLLDASNHDEIWTYLDEPTPHTVQDIESMITDALNDQALGKRLPFAVVALGRDEVVGSMSFIDIRWQSPRIVETLIM